MKDETLLPDFDAWSRRCEIQLLLCNREFREVAEFTWDAACRAALQSGNSAQPVTVPDGYVLVPVEPTVAMTEALWDEIHESRDMNNAYRAMLSAAPTAPDGWIPVSERMPENNSYVSVVSRHGEYVSGLVNGEWLDLHDGSSFPVSEIYLWLTLPCLPSKPLPDAPKVKS